MDVWRLTVAALRRWYVLLPALGVVAFLAIGAGKGVAPEYQTSGAALLVPPQFAAGPVNVYAGSSGPQALQIIVSGSETRSKLAQKGMTAAYVLSVDARSSIFDLQVTGTDPKITLATASGVLQELTDQAAQQQEAIGVPRNAMAQIQILDAPDALSESNKSSLRVTAVAALVGTVGAVALAVCFDDLMLLIRRRSRAGRGDYGPNSGVGGLSRDGSRRPAGPPMTNAAESEVRGGESPVPSVSGPPSRT